MSIEALPSEAREVIRVAATFTVEPLAEALGFWIDRIGVPADIDFAPYHQLFQQLLDPGSALRSNTAGFNVVWLRWDDLVPDHDDWLAAVNPIATELGDALVAAAGASQVPWLVVAGPGRDGGRVEANFLSRIAAGTNVHVIEHDHVVRHYPVDTWADADGERFGHVPYTRHGFAAVASALARRITALRASPRKVIVLDCDNTLWRGVVGEDGAAGVALDEPYLALQRFMHGQKQRGRLLCLASKNEEADALSVFDERDDMVLRRDDLVSWRINWSAKPDNLAELAAELGLGLDSFVFVDDNPVECAAVRAQYPEVLTLQLPERAADIPAFLRHVWAFDAARVTDADRGRTASYQRAVERERLRGESSTLSDFIASLQLRVDTAPVAAAEVPRVSQLTQRTNQFNSTTFRLDEAAVRGWLAAADRDVLRVRVADRFGDYGLVGVILAEVAGAALRVRGLLLSCRALGRGVEHAMIAQAGALAQRRGLDRVELEFRASARNLPVHNFLDSLGAEVRADGETTVYTLAADRAAAVEFRPGGAAGQQAERAGARGSSGSWPDPDIIARIPTELSSVDAVLAAVDGATRPRPDTGQAFVPPRGERERAIAAIWCDVLHLDRVGTRDRFTDLGGSSIQLVRVHGLLLSQLGIDLDITTLFQHPTVAELATALDQGDSQRLAGVSARANSMRGALRAHRTLDGLDRIKELMRG